MRWLRRGLAVAGGLLASLVAVLLSILLLLSSESGSRWLLDAASQRNAKAGLSFRFGSFRGRLLGDFQILDAALESPGLRIVWESLEFDWRPRALLAGRLDITALRLANLALTSTPGEAQAPAAPVLPELDLPLGIELQRLQVDTLRYEQGGERWALDDLALTARVDDQQIALLDVTARGLGVEATADLRMAALTPHAIQGELALTGALPDAISIDLQAQLAGYALRPQISLALRQPADLDARLTADLRDVLPAFDAQIGWAELSWPLTGPAEATLSDGELTLVGSPGDYQLQMVTGAGGPGLPSTGLKLAGRGDQEQIQLQPLELALLDGSARVEGVIRWAPRLSWELALSADGLSPRQLVADLTGSLAVDAHSRASAVAEGLRIEARVDHLGGRLGDRDLQLSADGVVQLGANETALTGSVAWQELSWPLTGDAQLTATAGRAQITGSPEDYQLTLDSDITAAALPPSQLQLRARGDLAGLIIEQSPLALLDGELVMTGALSWEPALSWDLQANAQALNPGAFYADWPGLVALALSTRGAVGDSGLSGSLTVDRFDGQLRGYPLAGTADLSVDEGMLEISAFDFSAGTNRLWASGSAADALDLSFQVDAPDLGALYPDLVGSLKGGGDLSGSRGAPALSATLAVETLRLNDLAADGLTLDADWDGHGGRLVLRGRGLASDAVNAENAWMILDGDRGAHQLAAEIKGADLSLSLTAAGALSADVWTGTLSELTLAQAVAGEWSLAESASLQVRPVGGQLSDLCLAREAGRLCLRGEWADDGALNASGELQDLPAGVLDPWLPEAMALVGTVNASLKASGTAQAPRLALDIQPSDGELIVAGQGETGPVEIPYGDLQVAAELIDDRMALQARARLGTDALAQLRLDLGPSPARTLEGALRLQAPNLAPLAPLLPAIDTVDGEIDANLSFGGSLSSPRVDGSAVVDAAALRLPDLGLDISELQLRAAGNGDSSISIDGGLRSGGELTLQAAIDLGDLAGPAFDLHLQGDHFEAMRLPDRRLVISPDLNLSQSGGEAYRIAGLLRVPEARVEVTRLPASAESSSADEIVIGDADRESKTAGQASSVNGDLRIELGEAVTIEAFGLSTGLTGAFNAVLDDRGQQLDGRIGLRDGRFKALGQDLTIERGQLLFAGPLSQAQVDLRAFRLSRDGSVTAYMDATGPLANPQTRIFSEPSLSDAEALAYLVTGNPLRGGGGSAEFDLTAAAFNLGLSTGAPLLSSLQAGLGLDELTVSSEPGGGVESSALSLGRYLSPDLYVGYSQYLFDRVGTVLLRLRLSDSVEVESTAGEVQSIDLFFKQERD